MARKPRNLTVSLSPQARAALDEIWDWNCEKYNSHHADRYVRFLRSAVERLAHEFFAGKGVPKRPELSFITIRRSQRGHGHVAVYALLGNTIVVIDFFHTAQDWQRRLRDEID
jgi:plasmid stabilization system protein ParE